MVNLNLSKEKIKEIIESYFDNEITEEKDKIEALKNIPLEKVKEKLEELPKKVNLIEEGFCVVKVTKLLPNGNALGGVIDEGRSEKIYIYDASLDASEEKIEKGVYLINKKDIDRNRRGLYTNGCWLFKSGLELTPSSTEVVISGDEIHCKMFFIPVYGIVVKKEAVMAIVKPSYAIVRAQAYTSNTKEVMALLEEKINETIDELKGLINKLRKEKEETLKSYEIVKINTNGGSADGYSRGYTQPPKYKYFIVRRGSNPDYWQYRYPAIPEDLIPQN